MSGIHCLFTLWFSVEWIKNWKALGLQASGVCTKHAGSLWSQLALAFFFFLFPNTVWEQTDFACWGWTPPHPQHTHVTASSFQGCLNCLEIILYSDFKINLFCWLVWFLLARKRQTKVASLKDPPRASLLFWAKCAVEIPRARAARTGPH